VQHAALAGGHGRERIGLAGLAYSFRCDFGCELELLGADRFEVHAVKAELVVLFRFEPQHFQRHVLQRSQKLAVALQQQATVRPGKIDHQFRALAQLGAYWRIGADAVLQTKSSLLKRAAEDLVNSSGGGNSILNRHGWGRVTSGSYGKTFLTSFGRYAPDVPAGNQFYPIF